jgi:hypothetical protein
MELESIRTGVAPLGTDDLLLAFPAQATPDAARVFCALCSSMSSRESQAVVRAVQDIAAGEVEFRATVLRPFWKQIRDTGSGSGAADEVIRRFRKAGPLHRAAWELLLDHERQSLEEALVAACGVPRAAAIASNFAAFRTLDPCRLQGALEPSAAVSPISVLGVIVARSESPRADGLSFAGAARAIESATDEISASYEEFATCRIRSMSDAKGLAAANRDAGGPGQGDLPSKSRECRERYVRSHARTGRVASQIAAIHRRLADRIHDSLPEPLADEFRQAFMLARFGDVAECVWDPREVIGAFVMRIGVPQAETVTFGLAVRDSIGLYQSEIAAAMDAHWSAVATQHPISLSSGESARSDVSAQIEAARARALALTIEFGGKIPPELAADWDRATVQWADRCQRRCSQQLKSLRVWGLGIG